MSARYFLDTNIFVYSFEPQSRAKQAKAEQLIEGAMAGDGGFISSQVIQELLNVALAKFAKPFSSDEAKAYLRNVLVPLCAVFPTAELYQKALEVHSQKGFSFYDSLIVASALLGGAKIIFTEDLQAGQKIDGLVVRNPFE